MRIDQDNKFTMYEGMVTFFDANAITIALIAALAGFVEEFKTLLASIKPAVKAVGDVKSGIAETKGAAENALVMIILTVGARLFAYANAVKDAALRTKSNFSKTTLYRLRDIELVSTGNTLHDTATDVLAKTAAYDINADLLADLKAKTDAYEKLIGMQTSGTSQHSTAVINVADKFRTIDTLFREKIDPLMASLEMDYPAFFREYKQTRLVKELGGSHKSKDAAHAPAAPTPSK